MEKSTKIYFIGTCIALSLIVLELIFNVIWFVIISLVVLIITLILWIKALPNNGGQIFWMSDE